MQREYNKYVLFCCLVAELLVWKQFGSEALDLAMKIGWLIWGLFGAIEYWYKKKKLTAALSLVLAILACLSFLAK